jgi:hypothetical protein
LQIGETESVYEDVRAGLDNTLFGIERGQRSFARIRLA